MKSLREHGVLVGGPTLPNGLPYPDGDEIIDLVVPPSKLKQRLEEAKTLPKALLNDIDVNWLQVSHIFLFFFLLSFHFFIYFIYLFSSHLLIMLLNYYFILFI